MIQDVFVIMPFTAQSVVLDGDPTDYSEAHFDAVYDEICAAVYAHNPACRVDRMEQKHGNLVSAIIRRLHEADLVIAVLTGRNPNVFYELGVRHSLRRMTIMLLADRREYPFDLSGYFSEEYSVDSQAGRRRLRSFVRERLVEYEATPLDDSPVLDVLEAAERSQWRALNNWETRRAAVVLYSLVSEIARLNEWLGRCSRWAENSPAPDGERPTSLRQSRGPLTLASFGVQQAVVGLPPAAYIHANNVVLMFDTLDEEVEQLANEVHRNGLQWSDEVEGPLALSIQQTQRALLLFATDVFDALDVVVQERRCYALPWSSRLDDFSAIQNTLELNEYFRSISDRMKESHSRVEGFLADFSGAPPETGGSAS